MRLTLHLLISHGRVARRMGLGPESRINMLRNILTGLVRHERLETTLGRADEVRFYAEKVHFLIFLRGTVKVYKPAQAEAHKMKLINLMLLPTQKEINVLMLNVILFCSALPQLIDYAKKGDTNEKAMKMASFWLTVRVCSFFKLIILLASTYCHGNACSFFSSLVSKWFE